MKKEIEDLYACYQSGELACPQQKAIDRFSRKIMTEKYSIILNKTLQS